MYYVYILESVSHSDEIYIGATADLRERLADHNSGKSTHTAKYVPWTIACYFAFPTKDTAYRFETYLKSHSGRAFARKRLLASNQT
jgi:putative endonuclease